MGALKGQGGGGTAKGGGKNRSGGGAVKVTKAKARETQAIEENILKLRAAIFDTNGRDKNVTSGIAPAFMKYERNGLDLSIEFATQLTRDESDWAFDLVKDSMEARYDASGYGWDDEDKERELTEKGARFLLIRDWPEDDQTKGDLVGFVHFRFTVQGEVIDKMAGEAQLYVYDIHIEDHSQRKGLGKHLMVVLELIARREKMSFISIPVMLGDDLTKSWLTKTGRGYTLDLLENIDFESAMEGFEVYSKSLEPPKPKPLEVEEVQVVSNNNINNNDNTSSSSSSTTATSGAVESQSEKVSGDISSSAAPSITVTSNNVAVVENNNVFSFAATAAALSTINTSTTTTTTDSSTTSSLTTQESEKSTTAFLPAVLAENEVEIIAGLTDMFAKKHFRQPTSEEVAQWIDSIRSLDTDELENNNNNTASGNENEDDNTNDDEVNSDNDNDDDDEQHSPQLVGIVKSKSSDSDDWVHVEK